jgi:hypothetical protein
VKSLNSPHWKKTKLTSGTPHTVARTMLSTVTVSPVQNKHFEQSSEVLKILQQ